MVGIEYDGSIIHFDMPTSAQKSIPINRNIIKNLLNNACAYGQQEMLALLIESLNISDLSDYERPLFWAIKRRKNEVVTTLLCNNFKLPNHGRLLHSTTRDYLANSYYQILTQKVSSIPTEPQERNKFILTAVEFKEDICQLLLDEVETLQNRNSLDQAIALLAGVLGLESGDNQDPNVLELVMKVDRPFSAMVFH